MNVRSIFFAGVIGFFALVSCDKSVPVDIFEDHNIPQEVVDDFHARYGDVVVTDAANWNDCDRIFINFNDAEGLPCEAAYKDGQWVLTTRDLGEVDFLSHLPVQVRESFVKLGYVRPRFDITDFTNRVLKITRKGIDHEVYDFRFHIELEDGTFTSIQVMINEDGLLLLNSREGYNKQENFLFVSSAPFDIIYEKYPGADVRSYADYGGRHQFFIIHEGRMKSVMLDSYSTEFKDFMWRETEYELEADTIIPVRILNYLEQWVAAEPFFSGFSYDKILFRENSYNGDWYGFQDTKREDKLVLWVNVKVAGNIVEDSCRAVAY